MTTLSIAHLYKLRKFLQHRQLYKIHLTLFKRTSVRLNNKNN